MQILLIHECDNAANITAPSAGGLVSSPVPVDTSSQNLATDLEVTYFSSIFGNNFEVQDSSLLEDYNKSRIETVGSRNDSNTGRNKRNKVPILVPNLNISKIINDNSVLDRRKENNFLGDNFIARNQNYPNQYATFSRTNDENVEFVNVTEIKSYNRKLLNDTIRSSVLLASQHNDPVLLASLHNNPVLVASQHNDPVLLALQHNDPVLLASQHNDPVLLASQHNDFLNNDLINNITQPSFQYHSSKEVIDHSIDSPSQNIVQSEPTNLNKSVSKLPLHCQKPQYVVYTWVLCMIILGGFLKLKYIVKTVIVFSMVIAHIVLLLTASDASDFIE